MWDLVEPNPEAGIQKYQKVYGPLQFVPLVKRRRMAQHFAPVAAAAPRNPAGERV